MKALVNSKSYPVNVTAGSGFMGNFNFNNRDWHLLDGRINVETFPSLSFLSILFPPAGSTSNRPYSIKYGLSCKSDIPGVPIAEIENYSSTPITGKLNTSTAKWVNFPVNTYKMADFSFSPSDVYGYTNVETNINPYIGLGSQYWNEQYILLTIQPSWITPAISGISVSGTDPRQNITISWTANIQDLVDVKISQGGVLKATLTGTTANSIVMPAGTVGAGTYTVEIIAANNPIDDLGVVGSASANFTAVIPSPTVSNVSVNQTEIRNPITVSWSSTLQTDFIAELIQNDIVKSTITGATATSAVFNPNILSVGPVTARVTVRNTVSGESSSAVSNYIFTATLSKPVITSLEPDGINQNVNSPIIVTWSATLQESYTLTVRQVGQILQVYNGTTAQSLTIPANLCKNGNVDLELICRNTVNGTTATAIRTATFLGFGKPEAPILDVKSVYNEAQPTFLWASAEQVAFEFIIMQNESVIETSGTVTGTVKQYKATQILSNNNTYAIKCRIKNQYDLWSDYAIKDISVSYTLLSKPTLSLISGDGAILVNGQCVNEPDFLKSEVWRKDDYSEFTRIGVNFGYDATLNDTIIASDTVYYYKIRAYSNDGGVVESDIMSESSKLRYVTIEDISTKQIIQIPYIININYETVTEIIVRNYAGIKKPRIHKGEIEYQIADIAIAKNKVDELSLKNMLMNSNVLLLRDRKGTMMFCSLSSSFKNSGKQNVTYNDLEFQLTEVEFKVEDLYDGGKALVLTYFDGTWMFDGTIDFSGQHMA